MWKLTRNQCFFIIFIIFISFFSAVDCFAEFTIEDEKKLGKEFYDKLASHHLLSENKRINDYINKIGEKILTGNKKVPFAFHFSVVNSSAINAFATPGGYIYINKGLINTVENEGELAGVIAHEIGHANARHIAAIIEKSRKINIGALAAILAGAFLGGGGDTTAAIAAFSVAGAATLSLKYSREHEEEADRLGIEYLTQAGYYPAAMVDFLRIMKKYEFISKSMPSYLLTHPGTDERIFYLDSIILTRYKHQKGLKNIIGNLNRIQALLITDGDDLDARHKQLENALAREPSNIDLRYSIALVEDKQGKVNDALNNYKTALNSAPEDEDILKSLGLLYLKIGKAEDAQKYLFRASVINPHNDEVTFALGRAYDALGKYNNALECYLKLKDQKIAETDIDIHYYIAMAYGKLNINGESHYNFALYFKKINKKDTALFHFKKALDYFPPGSERANNIKQEIQSLTNPTNPPKTVPKI